MGNDWLWRRGAYLSMWWAQVFITGSWTTRIYWNGSRWTVLQRRVDTLGSWTARGKEGIQTKHWQRIWFAFGWFYHSSQNQTLFRYSQRRKNSCCTSTDCYNGFPPWVDHEINMSVAIGSSSHCDHCCSSQLQIVATSRQKVWRKWNNWWICWRYRWCSC